MEKSKKPYYDICAAVSIELKRRGLSYTQAANKLGISLAAVSNQLSGNKPFGRLAAEKWHLTFGFNTEFLMFGAGAIVDDCSPETSSNVADSLTTNYLFTLDRPGYKPLIRNLINIIQAGGNYFATEAFDCMLRGEPQSKIDECISNATDEARLTKLAVMTLDNMGDSSYDEFVKEYQILSSRVNAMILKFENARTSETGGQYSFGEEAKK